VRAFLAEIAESALLGLLEPAAVRFTGQHDDAELLIFHIHQYNPFNLLFDNVPRASRTNRVFPAKRTMTLRGPLMIRPPRKQV
jgi:hypothetical protein